MPSDPTQADIDAAREWLVRMAVNDHNQEGPETDEERNERFVKSLASLLARHRAPLVGLLREARDHIDFDSTAMFLSEMDEAQAVVDGIVARIDAATGKGA